jgi:hypothetical protein
LLCSTSCGIDVQLATQCQPSSALTAGPFRFNSAFPGVGTLLAPRGDQSRNEAATAAQRKVDNILCETLREFDVDPGYQRSECWPLDSSSNGSMTGCVLYVWVYDEAADVHCPNVNMFGCTDLARVVYRTATSGNGRGLVRRNIYPAGTCSQAAAILSRLGPGHPGIAPS